MTLITQGLQTHKMNTAVMKTLKWSLLSFVHNKISLNLQHEYLLSIGKEPRLVSVLMMCIKCLAHHSNQEIQNCKLAVCR